MKTIRMNRDFKGKKLVSTLIAATIGIVGFIMSLPFAYVMVFGEHEPYISAGRAFAILLIMIGLPMFFYGIIAFLLGGKTMPHYGSTTDTDVGRIRHAVEMERMVKK